MGKEQSKYSQDAVDREKQRYLHMDITSKRQTYLVNQYTEVNDIPAWPQYTRNSTTPTNSSSERTAYQPNLEINNRVSIWQGDITELELESIVNSTGKVSKGLVNQAIQAAAGPYYRDECIHVGLPDQGQATITGGYRLPAKYVVNTLAPRKKTAEVLQDCYRNSLDLASRNNIKTLAFPCIATYKWYKFPKQRAGHLALEAVRGWLESHPTSMDRIVFCLWQQEDLKVYEELMPIYFPLPTVARPGGLSETQSGGTTVSQPGGSTDSQAGGTSDSQPSGSSVSQSAGPSDSQLGGSSVSQLAGTSESQLGGPSVSQPAGSYELQPAGSSGSQPSGSSLEVWRQQYRQRERGEICIRRGDQSTLFKDLCKFYKQKNIRIALCRRPYVIFEGESGLDWGGLTREYFCEAISSLTSNSVDGPVFEGCSDHRLPCASKVHLQCDMYKLVGRALAHSILHNGIGLAGLSRGLVYMLSHEVQLAGLEGSDVPLCMEDIADADLQIILKVDKTDDLTAIQKSTVRENLERCNVGHLPINDEFWPYIKQEMLLYEVAYRRWPQIEALREGMQSLNLYKFLCENRIAENIKEVFPTMEQVNVDPHMILNKVRLSLESLSGDEVGYFIQLLDDLYQGNIEGCSLKTLLHFWTGQDTLPLSEPLRLDLAPEKSLPSACTCFFQLHLPGNALQSYDTFKSAFQTALTYGAMGFGEM